MYLDKMNQMEPGTTVRLDTNISENVIDLGAAGGPYEDGGFIVITVTEAWNTATSMAIDVVTDDAVGLATAAVVVATTGQLLIAALALAKVIVIPLPAGVPLKRYLGLKYTKVGTANTTGKVTAIVTPDVRMNPYVNVAGTATKMFSN